MDVYLLKSAMLINGIIISIIILV